MRRPLLVLAFVALVALLAPTAHIGGSTIAPKDGRYAGKSAQGYPVKFKVRKRVVTGQYFKISGSGGCSFVVYATTKGKVSATGTFRISQDAMKIKGRFVTATKVKGTISDPECMSAPAGVAFSAKRVASTAR